MSKSEQKAYFKTILYAHADVPHTPPEQAELMAMALNHPEIAMEAAFGADTNIVCIDVVPAQFGTRCFALRLRDGGYHPFSYLTALKGKLTSRESNLAAVLRAATESWRVAKKRELMGGADMGARILHHDKRFESIGRSWMKNNGYTAEDFADGPTRVRVPDVIAEHFVRYHAAVFEGWIVTREEHTEIHSRGVQS